MSSKIISLVGLGEISTAYSVNRLSGARPVLGIDGISAEATVLANDEYLIRDLSKPIDLGREFDLVLCVANHLDSWNAEVVLDSVCRHAGRTIIFCTPEPGQPGHEHADCKPLTFWLERLAARGWYPEVLDSLSMRALATISWLRRNLVVLRRGNSDLGVEAAAALVAIGNVSFNWYHEEPGIKHFPFSEEWPPRELMPSALDAAVTSDLPRAPLETLYSLDVIVHGGGSTLINRMTTPLNVKRGATVRITGWAIDQAAKTEAGGVMALVDGGAPVRARYRISRPDVAEALGSPSYGMSGFEVSIDTAALSSGPHRISLRILDRGRLAYYLVMSPIDINVQTGGGG